MGSFTDQLGHRIRARKAATKIRHPRGFKGTVMWCSLCRGEMFRAPPSRVVTMEEQKAAYDRHMETCAMRETKGARTIAKMHRNRYIGPPRRRWRTALVVALLLVAAVAVGWLIASVR